MSMANMSAYAIPGISTQNAGIKPKSGNSGNTGNMIVTFLEMLQSSANVKKPDASPVNSVLNNSGGDVNNKAQISDKSNAASVQPEKTGKTDRTENSKDKIKKAVSEIFTQPEAETEFKDENATQKINVQKLLELFGVPQEIAIQMIDSYINSEPDNFYENNFSFNFNISEIENFISSAIQKEEIPQEIRQILSDFSEKLRETANNAQANQNVAQTNDLSDIKEQMILPQIISQTDVFKVAVTDYISGSETILQSGHEDKIMKDRAELMTKAIESLDGANKSEIVSALKTIGAQNSGQNVQKAMSVQEMFNAMTMRKTPAELTNANLNQTQTAVPETVTETKAAVDIMPDITILNFSENMQNISLADITAETNTTATVEQQNVINAQSIAENSSEPETANAEKLTSDIKNSVDLSVKTVKSDAQNVKTGDINSGKTAETDRQNLNLASPGIINARDFVRALSQQSKSQAAEIDMAQSAKEISKLISDKIQNNAGVSKGEFEISMKLSPKELGELLIKVTYSKGSVVLNITAANKSAESGILSRISELKESLAVRGVDLAGVEVNSSDFNGGGQNNGYNYNTQRDGNNGGKNNGNYKNSGGYSGVNSFSSSGTNEISQEIARREIIMNHMKNRRLLYKTI